MGRAFGLLILTLNAMLALAQDPKVEQFSPQGEIKNVRQVTARFATPMVPFGSPTQTTPFNIDCPVPGSARWIDDRNWAYEFERDVPAGLRCVFSLTPELKDATGARLRDATFSFDTGGPAIVDALPYEGDERIDESQVFVLALDTPANEATVERQVYCDIGGRGERVPVRILRGAEKKTILDRRGDFLNRYRQRVTPGSDEEKALRARDYDKLAIVLLACKARLPNESQVSVVWGKGIAAASGVETRQDQTLTYKVRDQFLAKFSCERTKPSAPCIPVLPLRVEFTAPVSVSLAERITLSGADGQTMSSTIYESDRKSGFTQNVSFNGPFPEKAELKLDLPDAMIDDASRPLANAKRFPLGVRMGVAPPLAKFPAVFGILELKAAPALPLTVRNVESVLRGKRISVPTDKASTAAMPGRTLKVQSPVEIVRWLARLERGQAKYTEGGYVSSSVFEGVSGEQTISVPRAVSGRAAEVIGIPLPKPGFYVVEVASPKLGASLLKDARPYYVSTGALVTNLAVHFKWGRESSLVWVTSLDQGEPVAKAEVQVVDCKGTVLFKGNTDRNGIARVKEALPERDALPDCKNKWDKQLFVSARLGEDMSFVMSDWDEGIAPWRFNLRTASAWTRKTVATVFDRTLLRVGETVSMKHFARLPSGTGFKAMSAKELATRAVIRHQGSNQQWEIPLRWDVAAGIAESAWGIPKDAKTGVYEVWLSKDKKTSGSNNDVEEQQSGAFRVEAFRVPLMRAQLSAPAGAQIAVNEVNFGVQLSYLSGGGAANQRVRIRSLVQPKAVSFPEFSDVQFANGNVIEGEEARDIDRWFETEDAGEATVTEVEASSNTARPLRNQSVQLDSGGAAGVRIDGLPKSDRPQDLVTEVEYSDANGEINTRSTRVPLWPSRVILGVKTDGWVRSKDSVRLTVIAVDPSGKPVSGVDVAVDAFEREQYSHRKRLIGGFYAYEYGSRTNRVGDFCSGRTDATGRLHCEAPISKSGNVILRARAADDAGNASYANADVWVEGGGEWWFEVSNDDRMDVVPERKRYEPGEIAKLQVRAPFRQAKALVTVEREGVIEGYVTSLSGKAPVVDVPIKDFHAPNVFISVLAVRGRVSGISPTALADLGKPAFRLGIAEVNVGWRARELKVSVNAEREVYKTRERARVHIEVKQPDGSPVNGGELALAAVDEGLLELYPNDSWDLLTAMMHPRAIDVTTATGVMQVVGKRHFGKKAVVTGGGGGRQMTRELFDTLLLWRGRVRLDSNGVADVEVPLNDSLTAFRIVAVASSGASMFGTASATIRTHQDVIVTSGLPALVRDADRFDATFNVRNGTVENLDVQVSASAEVSGGSLKRLGGTLDAKSIQLAPSEAKDVVWEVSVPPGAEHIQWKVSASARREGSMTMDDAITITQRVTPVTPVRVVQSTLTQVDRDVYVPVAPPAQAIPGRGEVVVLLQAKLSEIHAGVRDFMRQYPYTCLEQRASQAIALRDRKRWDDLMVALPAYLDNDGLAKYFASESEGSDALTSYLLAVSHSAGWEIPEQTRVRMLSALNEFVQGRLTRKLSLAAADTTMRRIAALEALTRFDATIDPVRVSSFAVEPNSWPTSTVIDWLSLLFRWEALPQREPLQREAEQVLRSRLHLQGSILSFSDQRRDNLWWLMVSPDVNANRALLLFLDSPQWREDVPRLARGALARQSKGAWNTTVANAWGTIALDAFGKRFESDKVLGTTQASVGAQRKSYLWSGAKKEPALSFVWPQSAAELRINHEGIGKPWATVQSRAAIALTAPLQSGYSIAKQTALLADDGAARSESYKRGDVLRVTLVVDAQADMTWVVISDPIPSGAAILGSGLGGEDLQSRAEQDQSAMRLQPVFEERTLEAYRAYYRYMPKGRWTVQYSMRLNNPGAFELPPSRVEAMYAPESFGEMPNAKVSVLP